MSGQTVYVSSVGRLGTVTPLSSPSGSPPPYTDGSVEKKVTLASPGQSMAPSMPTMTIQMPISGMSFQASPMSGMAPPMGMTSPTVSAPVEVKDKRARFNAWAKKREMPATVADLLYKVLSEVAEVKLVIDDSDSMAQEIAEEGKDPFAPKNSTRWLEAKKISQALIDLTTCVRGEDKGLDIYFINRPTVRNVKTLTGLQAVFSSPPNGDTPLSKKLVEVFDEVKYIPSSQNVLVIVIGDGEPTSSWGEADPRGKLKEVLLNKADNIHISFAECTDQEDDMEYLDQWDGLIKNFDNTEDYREELAHIQNVQGSAFKFDFNDYVAKIVLATFYRWFFRLDQMKVTDARYLRR